MKKSIFVFLLLTLPLLTSAQELPNIQVGSSGSVQALPDFINIEVTIEKIDKDRAEAKKMADTVTQAVLDAASLIDIDEKHVVASQLFIAPQYQWNEQTRVLVGQRAVRTVQIKLYDLERYSELADSLVKIDITRMNQQGTGFDNIEEHQNQALIVALRNARQKAEVVAAEIDRTLGPVFQVSESFSQPAPVMRRADVQMMAEAAPSAPAAPLEVKEQTIRANVAVIYLLD